MKRICFTPTLTLMWILVAAAVATTGRTQPQPPTADATSNAPSALPADLTQSNAPLAPAPAATQDQAADATESPFNLVATADGLVQGQPINIGQLITLTLKAEEGEAPLSAIEEVNFNPDEKQWHLEAPWHRRWLGKKGKDENDEQDEPWVAQLRPFETGSLTLPEVTVAYRNAKGELVQAQARPASVQVDSIQAPGAKNQDLIGLRGPQAIPRDWRPVWIALAVVMAAALTLWWLIRRWRRRGQPIIAQAPPTPQLPPGLWALEEIDRRSRLPMCTQGPAKAIFSSVSEVVRLYLQRRFDVPAIDMTTIECMDEMRQRQPGQDLERWLEDFLNECDMVKFTKQEPPRERWATIWNDARLIVKMTTPPQELGVEAPPASANRTQEATV